MPMIGYSQLMKDIFNVDKDSVEMMLKSLAKHKPTELRMKVLYGLAKTEESTISALLKMAGENNTGGTYKTIHSFFRTLEKDCLLCSQRRGYREYWRFTEKAKDLQIYLNNSD